MFQGHTSCPCESKCSIMENYCLNCISGPSDNHVLHDDETASETIYWYELLSVSKVDVSILLVPNGNADTFAITQSY